MSSQNTTQPARLAQVHFLGLEYTLIYTLITLKIYNIYCPKKVYDVI